MAIIVQVSPNPAGPEVKVNTTTSGTQSLPAITALDGGGYVITFISPDPSGSGIYQQLYSATGVALGGETRVNSTTANAQTEPAVASLASGGYVVTWQSSLQDGSSNGIYQQRFDASGNTVGGETLVNTATANDQTKPAVAGLSGGGHVVAWQSWLQDGSSWGVYQQRYNAAGIAVGSETRVNTTMAGEQSGPAVTGLAGGGYVVTWHAGGQDGGGYGTYQQVYTASGAMVGAETRVNTTTASDQIYPSIAALKDGGYVVVWESNLQDGANFGIYCQIYNASGVAVGSETRVNTTTANSQELPEVAATADGGFVVTWHSNLQDGSSNGVYQQRYDASGAKVGGETQVNIYTTSDQFYSDVAGLADGSVITTWISVGQDGSGNGIYHRLSLPVSSMSSAVERVFGDATNETILVGAGGLNAGDTVDGGAGTDTLTFSGGTNSAVGATITGIEAIALTNTTDTTLTVTDAAMASLVTTATGSADTLILDSGTLTVAERRALFDRGVETIQEGAKTYLSTNAAPTVIADSITASEDGTTPVLVLANDTDNENDTLSLVTGTLQVTGVTASGLTLPGGVTSAAILAQFTMDGTSIALAKPAYFDFLNVGQSITISFGYDVTDNVASTTAGTLTYTIMGANDVLTTGVDHYIGDATNETILVGAGGLNAGDTVDGGAGTDTLTFSGGTNSAVGATITGIEAIALTNTTGTTLTVTDAAMASLVTTATGSADTLILASGTLTVAERRALFDRGVETIQEGAKTYLSTNKAPVTVADTATRSEDSTAPVLVLANDTDNENDTLSLVTGTLQVTGVTASGLTLPGGVTSAAILAQFTMDGTSIALAKPAYFDFLNVGQSITISFGYDVTDNVASTTAGTLTYTIMGANDVLTTGVDHYIGDATNETILVGAGGLNAGDTVDGGAGTDTLTFSGGTNSAVGATITGIEAIALTNTTGTTLTVTDAAMASLVTTATGGSDTLILASGTLTVAQRKALFTAGVETIQEGAKTYLSTNAAPTVVADSVTASEDGTTPVLVLANDTDNENDTLSLVSGSLQVTNVTASGLTLPGGVTNAAILSQFTMDGTSISLANPAYFDFLNVGQSITISFGYDVTDNVASTTAGTLTYTIMGETPATAESGVKAGGSTGTPIYSYLTSALPVIVELPSSGDSQPVSNTPSQTGLTSNIDGDRFDDVLFQNSATGKIGYVNMTAGKAGGFVDLVSTLPQGWNLIGSQDINGDGRADIVVQNGNTGSIFFAAVTSGTPSWSLAKGGLIAAQQAIAIGDITGDGTPDLLIKDNGTGRLTFAALDKSGAPGVIVAGPDTGFTWRTVGLGDVNHDGASDVLVQDIATGRTAFYDARNKSWGSVTSAVGSNWIATEAADLNGDGRADVVFRNSTNNDIGWVDMRAGKTGELKIIVNGRAGFDLVGSADVDNDGSRDLILQNHADGATFVVDINAGVAGAWTAVTATLGAQWNAVA